MKRSTRFIALCAALVCTASAKANAVLEWNDIMLSTLVGQSAVNEARIAAITQLAVFEGVNSITREYQPYRQFIDADAGASTDAAAIAAAHTVLRFYAPQRAEALDAARTASLGAILDGAAKNEGVAVGEAAAHAMLNLRANDGSAAPEFYLPGAAAPGAWSLTASCTASGGVFVHWRNVIPFSLESASQFRLEPPPALTSKRYARALEEVKRLGAANSTARSADRADVARFYAAVLTIRTWNPAATQTAMAQGRSATHTARALAMLNMAMSDALVAVFDSKYHHRFWRPETAIRAADQDGNRYTTADPLFTPFVNAPCHPSYGSAHASAGYAARTVLERIYGRRNHFITLTSAVVPGVELQYTSFKEIAADIDDARIYGGIHFRFDQEAGAALGRQVGAHVYRNQLRCLNAPHVAFGRRAGAECEFQTEQH